MILRIICLIFHYTPAFLRQLHTGLGAFIICSHFNSTKMIDAIVPVVNRSVISGVVGHLRLHVSRKWLFWCLIVLVDQLWIIFTQRFAFILPNINCVRQRLNTFYLIKCIFANSFDTLSVWKPLFILHLWIIFVEHIRIIMTVFDIIQHSFRLMVSILFILHFLEIHIDCIQ
jgi:hypothetical protein